MQAGAGLERGAGLTLDENDAGSNAAAQLPRVQPLSSPTPECALWWCTLHADAAQLEACTNILSPAERARAARFGHPQLRDRYTIGRAALRKLLGQLLAVAPSDVPIVRGPRGRPQFDTDASLDFNVSHTGDAALIGCSRDARIGVDIERADRGINVAGIARKFLTAREREALPAQDADTARRSVLTLWTCKEAMSKATGDALTAPFAALDIDLRDGPRLRAGPGKYRPAAWSLHRADAPDGYIATVALWHP